jgi:hypothetical protein
MTGRLHVTVLEILGTDKAESCITVGFPEKYDDTLAGVFPVSTELVHQDFSTKVIYCRVDLLHPLFGQLYNSRFDL